jgi:hypothetical protein
MSRASEEIKKREVVMADGRYLIFYTFAPFDRHGSPRTNVPIPEAKADKSDKEN